MNQVDRYIEEVKRNLLATEEERNRFESDLRTHFTEAASHGEPVARTIEKLGSVETVAEAFNAERPFQHAGFFKRLAAFLGDMTLFLLFAVPVVASLAIAERTGSGPENVIVVIAIGLTILTMVGFGLLYFPLLEKRFGKTLGKYLMQIRVVDEGGRPITFGQAVIRRLSLYFELLALDAIFIPFTERKQRAFDIVARTIVVNEPGQPTPVWAWVICFFGWVPLLLVLLGIVALGA